MKEFLTMFFTNRVAPFLAKYHIPLPIAALGIFLIIFIPLVLLLVKPSTNTTDSQLPQPTRQTALPTKQPISTPTLPPGVPTPTINPDIYYQNNQQYKDSVDKASAEEQAALKQDHAVFVFISSLPYKGTNVSVTYHISDNSVVAVLKKTNLTAANKEFDDLLLKYGIKSRTWIPSLEVTTE